MAVGKGKKKRRRARSSRLLNFLFRGIYPASLTEGDQPVVCWPAQLKPGL